MLNPIIAIEIYLFSTLLLYSFGIWDYETNAPLRFYTTLISYHVIIFLGYYFFIHKHVNTVKEYTFFSRNNLKIFFTINLFMMYLACVRVGGLDSFSIVDLYNKVLFSILDPSAAYRLKFLVTRDNVFLGFLGTLILVSWSPIAYAILPMGFYYYKELNKIEKSLFIANILMTLLAAIVIGTTKRIVDLGIISLMSLILLNPYYLKSAKRNLGKKFLLLLTLLVVISIAYQFVGSRGFASYWNDSNYLLGGLVPVDHDSIIFDIFPESMYSLMAIICSYFTQGYFPLSYAFDVDNVNFHLGYSSLWFVDKFDLNHETYQYAVEAILGWDSRVQWASAYTWIANDVGFIGLPIVLFFIGAFIGTLYKEFVEQRTLISFILLYYMFVMIFYLPCNFQIFQDIDGVIGFHFFLFLWVMSRLKISFKL